ncbi:MAG: rhomboid family intramembrane serine protease [Clostridium sp.]|nr:rhomboid family intramembrane serine protease [Clostridium sp.]
MSYRFTNSYTMGTPPVTKNLIIINILFFFASIVAERYGIRLDEHLGLHFALASNFRIWQVFTYMFLHANLQHILFNMFALWMFGRIIESAWGSRRFLIYYMVCGVGAGLMQEGAQYLTYLYEGLNHYEGVNLDGAIISMTKYLNRWTTVGASGAVYGILLAFGMTFPNESLFIFPLPVPIKAKFFVVGYAAIELFAAISSSNDGVAHLAHLGGMLFGLLLILHWRNKGRGGYGRRSSESMADKIKNFFHRFSARPRMSVYSKNERNSDYEFNARKKERTEEMDRILDKVKKSGYTSLTEEEKRKLFDASQR